MNGQLNRMDQVWAILANSSLKNADVSPQVTYAGIFLTFHCGFHCSYCINRHGALKKRKVLTASEWERGLNRLQIDRSRMVPLTIQGGEPSYHPAWIDIINRLRTDFYIDLMTNLDFDIDRFMKEIPPDRLKRDVPYASIRVSYHPEHSNLIELIGKIKRMQEAGYSIGLFMVDHPASSVQSIKRTAQEVGIDFRLKDFLGIHEGVLWGQYKYEDAVCGPAKKDVECRSTELLIAPDGNIHRCHRDLYAGENKIANILDDELKIEFPFRYCDQFGNCSPCDQKIKTDRYQRPGACSVEIRPISH